MGFDVRATAPPGGQAVTSAASFVPAAGLMANPSFESPSRVFRHLRSSRPPSVRNGLSGEPASKDSVRVCWQLVLARPPRVRPADLRSWIHSDDRTRWVFPPPEIVPIARITAPRGITRL